jgi:hypothetical protein
MAAALHTRAVTAEGCGSGGRERIQHNVASRLVEAAEALIDELPFKVVRSNGADELLARGMNLLIARAAYREAAPAKRVHARYSALGPPHMQLAGPEVDVVPPQRHELASAQAMAIGEQDCRRIPMAPAVAPRGLH